MQSNYVRNCGGAWPGPVFAVAVSLGCEKVRPAALCHRESAKKFAQRAQNTPNSAFLCLLGEFFRGRAAGGAVLGEFFRANRHCAGLGGSSAPSRPAAVGVLRHAKPSGGASPACRRLGWRHSPGWWRRDRDFRWCGRQSADPLVEKRRKRAVLAEWVCTLADVLSVVVCRSHANSLLRA